MAEALVLVFFLLVWLGTQPLVNAAEEFLGLLSRGENQQAYESTSSGFKQAVSAEDFDELVTERGLSDDASMRWTVRVRDESNLGEVGGFLTTRSGQTFYVEFHLVHVTDRRLIYEPRFFDLFTSTKVISLETIVSVTPTSMSLLGLDLAATGFSVTLADGTNHQFHFYALEPRREPWIKYLNLPIGPRNTAQQWG